MKIKLIFDSVSDLSGVARSPARLATENRSSSPVSTAQLCLKRVLKIIPCIKISQHNMNIVCLQPHSLEI